jgi:hypothetical protein
VAVRGSSRRRRLERACSTNHAAAVVACGSGSGRRRMTGAAVRRSGESGTLRWRAYRAQATVYGGQWWLQKRAKEQRTGVAGDADMLGMRAVG